MKSHNKVIVWGFVGLLAFWYGHFALMEYRGWVKEATVGSFEACMLFERDREGEDYCLAYARNNDQYQPFPLTRLIPGL